MRLLYTCSGHGAAWRPSSGTDRAGPLRKRPALSRRVSSGCPDRTTSVRSMLAEGSIIEWDSRQRGEGSVPMPLVLFEPGVSARSMTSLASRSLGAQDHGVGVYPLGVYGAGERGDGCEVVPCGGESFGGCVEEGLRCAVADAYVFREGHTRCDHRSSQSRPLRTRQRQASTRRPATYLYFASRGVRPPGRSANTGRPADRSVYRLTSSPAVAEITGDGRPWTVLMISLLSMPCR
jgi:hypothetical protein